MKNFFVFLFSILLFQATAQKPKDVFFEIGGCGGLGSFNYEKTFRQKGPNALSLRTGLGFSPIDKNNGSVLVFPVMINLNHGEGNLKFEAGIGQGITITTKGSFFIRGVASVGYKFQKTDSPWFFKIAYTPLISYLVDFQWQHWAGISIGYHLKSKSP